MKTDKLFPVTVQGESVHASRNSWWEHMQRWIAANTFTPIWLPLPLRSQLAGYCIAALLQILAVASVILLLHIYPRFAFIEAPAVLVILLISLGWGAGPGTFTTIVGACLIAFLALPPFYSLHISGTEDVIGIVLFLIIGVAISLLTSQAQRARAEAEQERQRFQDVFMQAPTPITVVRGPEYRVELINPAALANTDGGEVAGKTTQDILAGRRSIEVLEHLKEVYKTGRTYAVKELYVPGGDRQDGGRFHEQYFDLTYRPMHNQKGEVEGALIFSIEVTDQVQARRRIEMAERHANERANEMEAILEAIADPLFIVDAQIGPRRINQAARELIGVPEQLPTGQLRVSGEYFDLYDEQGHFLPREVWPQTRILAGEVLQGAAAVDVIMQTHDGRRLNLSVTGAPVRNAAGDVQSAVLIIRDVTARRQADLERSRLLAREEAILKVMPVGFSIVDAQGRLLRRNAVFEQIWGKNARFVEDKDEFVEYKAWWVSNGRRLASEDWGLYRALTRGEISLNEEIDIETFDGLQKTILHAAAPIYDEAGQLLGGVAAMLDVTERKQLERRTHAALEALLAMAQVMVQGPAETEPATSAFDAEETLSTQAPLAFARQTIQRLVGLAYEVLRCERVSISLIEPETMRNIPMAVKGLSPEQERIWWQEVGDSSVSDYLDARSVERLQNDEVLVLDLAHGEPLARDYYGFGLTLAVPLLSRNRLLGVLGLDYGEQEHYYTQQEIALARAVARLTTLVVEREQLLTERAEARANELALRDANRLKDEFIGIAGHELRTPLTTIKASVQLAQRQLKRVMQREAELPDEIAKSITTVQNFLLRTERQVGMQSRLVNDLLDVSRVETGRLELHPALCNMISLVEEVIEDQRYLTPDRTITLTLPADAESPIPGELLVMADADRVRQVISNYLSNALKYSSADEPVAVFIECRVRHVRVAIRDQGPGLSESQQQRIWERFYRAPGIEVRSGSGVGLGLGLHISRMIIERQGGRVGVQSAPGKGSTFWFTLLLAE